MSTSSILASIFTPATDKPGSDAAHAQQAVVKDQDYFMDLSPVIFQIENSLFRVPRYHFVKGSEIFAKFLQKKGICEGSRTENPIQLSVSCADFRNFLKLVYPQTVLCQADLSKDEWSSVLKLSNMWYFLDLRQMALEELEEDDFGHLNSLEKIKFGKEYYIPDCLLSGYLEFITRDEPITDEEAIAMGSLEVVRLCRIRETFVLDDTIDAETTAGENIEEEFHEELFDLRERAAAYLPSTWGPGPAGSSSLGEVVAFVEGVPIIFEEVTKMTSTDL